MKAHLHSWPGRAPLGGLTATSLALGLVIAPLAAGVEIQVASSGVDGPGCGGAGSPCASLSYALTLDEVTGPGDTITMAAGTYTPGGSAWVIESGEAGNPLTIRGAGPSTVIDGANVGANAAITVYASHVVIEDLAVTNTSRTPIIVQQTGHILRRLSAGGASGNQTHCLWLQDATSSVLEELTLTDCPRNGLLIDGGGDIEVNGLSVSGAGDHGLRVENANGVTIRGGTLDTNAVSCADCSGISFFRSNDFELAAWQEATPSLVRGHAGAGISVTDCDSGAIHHVALVDNAGGVLVENSAALVMTIEHISVTGSSALAIADSSRSAQLTVTSSVLAFNPGGDLDDAAVAHHHNLRHQNGSGNIALDATETDSDPLFADSAAGDLHLRSQGGRYLPGTGWVTDATTSPAIDRGEPALPFVLEPAPNGGRANAGAFGNTGQASRSFSGPLPDAGGTDLAVASDSALPDLAAPDRAADDSAQQDAALPDTASPDQAGADSAVVDVGAPDGFAADHSAGLDGGARDTLAADATASRDTGSLPDRAALTDAAATDLNGGADTVSADVAAALVARAGPDQLVTAPVEIVLDGSASTAPAGAQYQWTRVDGPAGASAAPIGTSERIAVQIDAPGFWVFQLTVSADGFSDSDQLTIEAGGGEAVVSGCGCGSADGAASRKAGPLALVLCGALFLLGRRRRARQ